MFTWILSVIACLQTQTPVRFCLAPTQDVSLQLHGAHPKKKIKIKKIKKKNKKLNDIIIIIIIIITIIIMIVITIKL
jgi:hypothetical protein